MPSALLSLMHGLSPLLLAAALGAGCSRPATAAPPGAAEATRGPGRTVEGHFLSKALGVDKRYRAWLPPGYDQGRERFPVIYLLHGLGGDEADWLEGAHLDREAARLGLRAILVTPDGDASFWINAATPVDYQACLRDGGNAFREGEPRERFCVRAPRYEDYVVTDLVDHVDATFRTIASREGRALDGFSMGGFGAFALAMRHPDRFAAAASHAGVVALRYTGPHPYRGEPQLADRVRESRDPILAHMIRLFGTAIDRWRAYDPAELASHLRDGQLALYLDCGTEDDFALQDSAAYLHDVLDRAGVHHQFALVPGRHSFAWARTRLPLSLAFLDERLHGALGPREGTSQQSPGPPG